MKTNYLSEFIKHTSTNIIGTIGLSMYVFADTYFISYYSGPIGLTTLNIAVPIYSVLYGLGYLLGIGGGINFTYRQAKGDLEEGNSYFNLSVTLGLILGLLMTLIGVFFTEPVAYFLGANGESIELAKIYIKTILLFSPFFILSTTLLSFLRYDDNPKLAMIALLGSSFFNIIGDYFLMEHMNLGIFGAALATALSPLVAILMASPHYIKRRGDLHLSKLFVNGKKFFELMRLGLSTFVYEMSAGLVILIYNYLILDIAGNIGVAAYGIVVNIATIVLSIFNGLQQGIQPLIGYAYGSGDEKGVKTYLRYGLTFGLVLSMSLYLLSIPNVDALISIFNSQNVRELHNLARMGILIYFLGFVPTALNVVFIAYNNATNNPRVALMLSLARGSVLVILFAYVLSRLYGMNGIWMSFPLAEVCTILLYILLSKKLSSAKL